jgi:hypothetical protein
MLKFALVDADAQTGVTMITHHATEPLCRPDLLGD